MFGRFSLILILILLFGCNGGSTASESPSTPPPVAVVGETTQIAPVNTPAPTEPIVPTNTPTATPRPLAASVNGRLLYLSDYETKLVQFREWYGDQTPDEQDIRAFTLDAQITQILLEQAAVELGIEIPDGVIEQAISEAITDSGGEEGYEVWLETSGFTEATYRVQLKEEMLAQAVLNIVTQEVPSTDAFVRARYVQVDDATQADTVLAELAAGADFGTLVSLYSIEPSKAVTKGDLGFFNRGTLLVPEVEAAAFTLNPPEVSDVLAVTRDDGSTTYYIVQTTASEPFRALSAEQYAQKLQWFFENWLMERRISAEIETFLQFDE
ncbi:MAG: SurA N-terminal domain-containing protein [Candidatus Promineifilaceae bacterium]